MPVADSLEITRRIEGLNSIGQYNYGDARLFSSSPEFEPGASRQLFHLGGVLVCKNMSTNCLQATNRFTI